MAGLLVGCGAAEAFKRMHLDTPWLYPVLSWPR
jgi:hypothetical protein